MPSNHQDLFGPAKTMIGKLGWESSAASLHLLLKDIGKEEIRAVVPDAIKALGAIGSVSSIDPLAHMAFVNNDFEAIGIGEAPYPQTGQTVSYEHDEWLAGPDDPVTLDAGRFVAAEDGLVAYRLDVLAEQTGRVAYSQPYIDFIDIAETMTLDAPMDVQVEGGEQIDAFLLPDALVVPTPVQLLGVDTLEPLPLRTGRPLTLEWSAPTVSGGEVIIMLEDPDAGQVWNVGDATSFTLPADRFLRVNDLLSLSVVRVVSNEVATAQGPLTVRGASWQFLVPEWVGAYSVSPTRWPVGETFEVEFADGGLTVPGCYYEFTRRYPLASGDLFQGFVAKSADRIFQSTDRR